jgi:hypothetical protein
LYKLEARAKRIMARKKKVGKGQPENGTDINLNRKHITLRGSGLDVMLRRLL